MDFEPFLSVYQEVRGASPQTISAYRSDLKIFGSFLSGIGITRIAAVDHKVIAAYVKHMKENGSARDGSVGLSDATIQRRLAAVSSYFSYRRATSDRQLRNPVEDFPFRSKKDKAPKPVDRDIIEKLIATITVPRDLALMELFLASGLRVSEMAQLDRKSIEIESKLDPTTGRHTYSGKGVVVGKGNKMRPFFVHAKALECWGGYMKTRKDDHPAMFLSERNQRMSVRAIQERLQYWCKQANIPHIRVHRLRHTFATWMINADLDVLILKDLMGHESIATTMQYAKLVDQTVARGYFAAMEYVNR